MPIASIDTKMSVLCLKKGNGVKTMIAPNLNPRRHSQVGSCYNVWETEASRKHAILFFKKKKYAMLKF